MNPSIARASALALVALLAQPTSTASGQAAAGLTPSEKSAASRITAHAIAGHIQFLSDDLLEGRGPGSRGDGLAQRYIAAQMKIAGLRPGATGSSYLQPVPLVGISTTRPRTVTFSARGRRLSLKNVDDIVMSSGVQKERSTISRAEVVFVGYGIVAPEHRWNDYKDVDVKGKVVLVMNNDPSSDPKLFGGVERLWYGRWDYKYLQAAKQGAIGAIVIHTTPSAAYPWSVIQSSNDESFELPAAPGEPRLEARMWATEDASRRIAALGGHDLDKLRAAAETREFRPVPLGTVMSLSLRNKLTTVKSANVLGLLPGSDPTLKNEVVVLTAHHDHLGIGRPIQGDSIYNGAIDNASGCAALLTIARAAALGPRPRRSILFMTVAAEEEGLLGSEWYTRHPTFAPGKIAANLNMDSVNKNGRTTDVGFIGFGKSSLDRQVTAIAHAQGRTVRGDPQPDRGSFYRSDQFNFARIGVPALYARGGPSYVGRPPGWGEQQIEMYIQRHYHQPSDEYDASWDLSGAVEDAQLYLLVALRVASDPRLPAWKPGDEFEAARKAALGAAR